MKILIFLMLMIPLISFAATNSEAMRTEVRSHLKEVKACYTGRMGQRPGTKGTMAVDWTVNDAGEVTKININEAQSTWNDTQDSPINSCIFDLFKSLKFAPANKGREVSASYVFEFSNTAPFMVSK